MIEKALNTIEKYNMINQHDKIVMGISGGPDSVAMFDILYNIIDVYNIEIFAVHINHMIRGADAERDEKFVENLCRSKGVPFFLFKEDIPYIAKKMGYSEEEAGRIIRYKALREVLNRVKGDKIAVAHNKNDVVETIILNILRGSGMEGLIGIKPVSGNIIRPMIEFSRSEIEDYIEKKELSFVSDKTNFEDFYRRNKVRLKLLPFIKENFNVDVAENLYRLSKLLSSEDDYMNIQTKNICEKICIFNTDKVLICVDSLKSCHIALKRRIIREAYKKVKGDLKGFEFVNVEDVLKLIDKQTSSKINLPFEIEALKSYNYLIIRKVSNIKKTEFYTELNIPGRTIIDGIGIFEASVFNIDEIDKFNKSENTQFFDYDKINGRIIVRNRKPKDTIQPLNMKGTKKLKNFFIDEKVPLELRDKIPLVVSEGEIIWVVGYRISDKFKLNINTKKVLALEYKLLEE